MSRLSNGARVLSATDLARACDVDLKTIHNWANRGKIPCWRTPGRHLRFRRIDVVDFMLSYELEIPEDLRRARPRVVAIESDPNTLRSWQRALGKRFEMVTNEHVVDALISLASVEADVVLIGDVSPLELATLAGRLRAAESTRHLRIVTVGAQAPTAHGFVPRGELGVLREVLERLTGLV